mgnify:CR=1 FL=1
MRCFKRPASYLAQHLLMLANRRVNTLDVCKDLICSLVRIQNIYTIGHVGLGAPYYIHFRSIRLLIHLLRWAAERASVLCS